MAHCACKFARTVCKCLGGSLRLLLFASTILLLVLALGNYGSIGTVLVNDVVFRVPITTASVLVHTSGTMQMIVAILGVYGSFYAHIKSLRWFSTMAFLNAMLTASAFLWFNASGRLDSTMDAAMRELREQQHNYDWQHSAASDAQHKLATRVWDEVQSFNCCGLKSPADWAPLRPQDVPSDAYPRSCCAQTYQIMLKTSAPSDTYCMAGDSLFTTGCGERIEQIRTGIMGYAMVSVVLQVLLAGLACLVARHLAACAAAALARRQQQQQLHADNGNEKPHSGVIFYPELGSMQVLAPPAYGSV